MTDFNGQITQVLENQHVRLEYLAASPRIVRLNLAGQINMFADLSQKLVNTPYGKFCFQGGHRLWHSPEAMPRTYIPDNEGAMVSSIAGGVRIDQPTETWTHISKSIEIRLSPGAPQISICHILRNDGPWPVELAPWTLTMFRLGGVVILPQPIGNVDSAGLLANRHLSVWPYTKLDDPRLVLRNDAILLRAKAGSPPVKVGYFNPHGWLGYWLDGVLFVKRFEPKFGADFPDGGCNSETYCNHQFVELESLGPLVKLNPGDSTSHTETWDLYDTLNQPFIPPEVAELMVK